MQRRNFLTAAAVSTAAPLAAFASTAPVVEIKVLETYLTNSEQFPRRALPAPGTRLKLRRDPSRAFDTRTIQVLNVDSAPLGYLPPRTTEVLAALMDSAVSSEALVERDGKLSVFVVLMR